MLGVACGPCVSVRHDKEWARWEGGGVKGACRRVRVCSEGVAEEIVEVRGKHWRIEAQEGIKMVEGEKPRYAIT